MVGILEEQHPERARLFMQWQRMGWPLLVDRLNLLEVTAVPITLLIDEAGHIRPAPRRVPPAQVIEEFLAAEPAAGGEGAGPGGLAARKPDLTALRRAARGATGPDRPRVWRELGEALLLWGGEETLDEAVAALTEALEPGFGDPEEDAWSHFRLGVAYRARYDSPHRRDGDFQAAVDHWSASLDLDPNNYITRRRLQQYGPRLDKPYPFYDWVETARREIRERGEEPVQLAAEPRGAEIAQPARRLTGGEDGEEPDPEGRIRRDPGRLVHTETVSVPAAVRPGEAARVHLAFRPAEERKTHWNNEVDELEVWVEPPAEWRVERRRLSFPNPPRPLSTEERSLELEISSPAGAASGVVTVPAYALYYVCEDVDGTCLYRRQDLEVTVRVAEGAP